ncbi:MAG: ATP-binding protein [Ginsengibacter sp.]
MIAEPLISFLLIRKAKNILQKNQETKELMPILSLLPYAIIALYLAEVLFNLEYITTWIWHFFLLGIIYLGVTREEYFPLRTIMYAVLPFAVISFAADVVKLFDKILYRKIDTYFDAAIFFSILWLVARLISSSKQEKALKIANERTLQEQEKRKWVSIKNEELEKIVSERTSELQHQKDEIEKTLNELKATQTQLIHSEKMASLGELTAGIAHEIQNPLNFVNNFSELNTELIQEMNEEIIKGNMEEVKTIASDIKENEEKIIFHGKRADAIVKGMLQHSRASNGIKEPTDINELCDEYLRLAYHGLRARDKSFNAGMKTDFDPALQKVNVVPQDIGRVVLNLLTNAFYAVKEKDLAERSLHQTDESSEDQVAGGIIEKKYEPMVSIATKSFENMVQIKVSDNGCGIPQSALDKIFQPFFTTKPTGEGTGLGLSMSYDIITKGHGGNLEVTTFTDEQNLKKQSGTIFTITIPK